jgi:hypothetical protein
MHALELQLRGRGRRTNIRVLFVYSYVPSREGGLVGIHFWYYWLTIAGRDIVSLAIGVSALTTSYASLHVARSVKKDVDDREKDDKKGIDLK